MLICYYYYNTVHISFYLEVISDKSIIFTLFYTGTFSLWSKDAGVLNGVVAQKKNGVGGGMMLRGVILYMMIINLSLPVSAAGQTASNIEYANSVCRLCVRLKEDVAYFYCFETVKGMT